MKLKKDVDIRGLKLVMRPVLQAADRVWKENGQELVITSALDGEHKASSLHYFGFALDLRTRYFKEDQKLKVEKELNYALHQYGTMYKIIQEPTHIHVEYQHVPRAEKWN